jgi:hypothetical protein
MRRGRRKMASVAVIVFDTKRPEVRIERQKETEKASKEGE